MLTRNRKRSRILILLSFFAALLLSNPCASAGEDQIDKINREIRNKGAKWVAGETSISRLPAELRRMRLGLVEPTGSVRAMPAKAPLSLNEQTASASAPVLPASLRYGPRIVTPVKDQGNCGSCWAFAVTAALESHVAMTTGVLTDLAEQVLLSCSYASVAPKPCGGGFPDHASDYILYYGLPIEKCFPYFPYSGQGSRCKNACAEWQSNTYGITAWDYVQPRVRAMKEALYAHGPIIATLNVNTDFYNYTSGVYSYAYGQYEGRHVVEVVGYDDSRQCFIAKNSWGTGWGEAGYFNIAYSQVNTYPVLFGTTTIVYKGQGALTASSFYQCGDQCADPGVVPPEAQWRIDGDPTWRAPGETLPVLDAGRHTLEFMDYEGWTTPVPQTLIVRKGRTVQAHGDYVLPTGALKVRIRPQGAITAGAQCNVDGGAWQSNSELFSVMPGRHVVRFKEIYGWVTPSRVVTTTSNGGKTTLAKGVYVQRTGLVTVSITKPRRAMWRLDNGSWNTNGAVITAGVGQHALTFSDVSGWQTPADQVVTVREGKTGAVSVAYSR